MGDYPKIKKIKKELCTSKWWWKLRFQEKIAENAKKTPMLIESTESLNGDITPFVELIVNSCVAELAAAQIPNDFTKLPPQTRSDTANELLVNAIAVPLTSQMHLYLREAYHRKEAIGRFKPCPGLRKHNLMFKLTKNLPEVIKG